MNSMSSQPPSTVASHALRGGMVGLGMIFDETYRPFFEAVRRQPLYRPDFGVCRVELAAVASRTGRRAQAYLQSAGERIGTFQSFAEPDSVEKLLAAGVDFVCVATPDDRHFAAARTALLAGKHVLIEKPSVLSLAELDELERLARDKGVLAKVVYHKLLDPDHKKLRTWWPTVNCGTSTTATARCWSPSRSRAASSPSGFWAVTPAPMWPCTISS